MTDSKLLKFGRKPERTAIRSFHMDRDAATVRYDDEKGLSKNDRIKMIDQEESLIGYASVLYVKTYICGKRWISFGKPMRYILVIIRMSY